MMANRNLLKPAKGEPITVPNKEMALGVITTPVLMKIGVFPSVLVAKIKLTIYTKL
jgi:DNA-directed RNA polymerase beta' subunit